MTLSPEEASAAVERHPCPKCEAPAGSACRTLRGKTAVKYHTPRFVQVSALRDDLHVLVPASRGPGKPWKPGPAPAEIPEQHRPSAAIRIGYARCSTAGQELASQLDALSRAGCFKVFQEKISTRIRSRPQFEAALALARDIKQAAPDQTVIFTVHELKRPARNAVELMQLAADLQTTGIQLELLTGPLTGIYDPNGVGSLLFAVLAVGIQLDRDYIRDKTLEGQRIAAANGRHGGRPKVIDDDMLLFATALRDNKVPMAEIAKKLTIKTGKNKGKHPSVASLYRAFTDAGIAEEPTELTEEQLAVVHIPQIDDPWWMRADFELSHVDGWQLAHFHYPDSPDKQINASRFPTGKRRHREARTIAEAAILALTDCKVSGWEEDQDGTGDTYWFAHLDAPGIISQ